MLRLVMYLLVLGVIIYAVFWAIDRRGGSTPAKPTTKGTRGPVGPDDDEDFLRDLEWKRRHPRPPGADGPVP